jgi:hypothetical protein
MTVFKKEQKFRLILGLRAVFKVTSVPGFFYIQSVQNLNLAPSGLLYSLGSPIANFWKSKNVQIWVVVYTHVLCTRCSLPK